ncbi:MAG: DsbC family protein [Alcanivorax sp.]|nr:DsbC family protein [Alcanivorax sp.]
MIKKIGMLIVCITAFNAVKADDMKSRVSNMLTEVTNGIDVLRIAETPIPNIVKVELSNGSFVYVTRDAQFMFPGKMFRHSESGLLDLTERDLAIKRRGELRRVDLEETITFKAKGEEKGEVYVFTDVSCGYCKKLHRHVDDINNLGITVHYLAFPRAGAQSPAAKLMRKVWCAEDRQRAITTAKQDGVVMQDSKECDPPITKQHQLGLLLGVTGTPGVYDSEGRHLGGYLTADQLKNAIL